MAKAQTKMGDYRENGVWNDQMLFNSIKWLDQSYGTPGVQWRHLKERKLTTKSKNKLNC